MYDFPRIKFRHGDSSEWENSNRVLASGEPGYAIDTEEFKIGDGVTAWSSLTAIAGGGSGINNVIEDITPQLGGDLDINNNDIIGTGNVILSGDITAISGTLNQLIFNTSLDDPDLLQGQLQWNATEGTLDLGVNASYAIHLGEELLYRVRNITGSTLLAGQPVYASGLSEGANNRIEVNLYAADGTIREVRFMGLITEDLTDNGNNGYVTQFGFIRKIDTRGNAAINGTTNKLWTAGEPEWYEGDILYVHPTVAGKLTKIEPKHSISVAIITSKGSNGKIFVRPTSYGHMNDMHDVNTSGVANLDGLVYNSSTDYWEPKHIVQSETAGITGASGVNNIVKINQADYDNLGSYDPNTIYFVI